MRRPFLRLTLLPNLTYLRAVRLSPLLKGGVPAHEQNFFFAFSFSFLAAFFFLAPATVAQTLKVGITSKTLFYLPYYLAQKKGLYAAENLKVELILIGRSDVQLQALIAGELHFASINPDGIIVINEKGGNLKVIAGTD